MDVVGGTIVWNLDADDSKFSAALSSAKKKADQTAKDVDSKMSSLSSSIKNSLDNAAESSKKFAVGLAAVGTAIAGAVGYGAKIAGDLEAARQGFVALLGSADKADATIARIKQEAAATPFELTGLITGAQALTAVTKDGNKAVDVLMDVGKAIATSGKGQAELDRVVLNLQQIASTGQVTAMDIRQFQSAIPIFNDVLAASGLTIEELQNSKTAANDLFDAFKKAGEAGGITAGGFTSQAGTFNQLVSNMKDNITILGSTIIQQTGIFDGLKGTITKINDVLANPETIKKITDFVTFIKDNFPIIAGIIVGGLTPALVGAATALWATVAPLLPFIAAGAAVGLAIKGIIEIVKNWGTITDWINVKLNSMTSGIANFANSIRTFFSNAWINIINEVSSWPGKLYDWGKNIANSFLDGIKSALSNIVNTFKNSLDSVKGIIKGNSPPKEGPLQNIDQWGFNIGQAWVDGMKSAISGFDLGGLSISSVGTENLGLASNGSSGLSQNIEIKIDRLASLDDLQSLIRELGYQAELSPLLST